MERNGQSIVEVLIGIAVGAILIVGAATVISPALTTNKQASKVEAAASLGKELADNVRAWSEGDWHNILNVATGSANTYYLNTSSSPFTVIASGTASSYSFSRSITIDHTKVPNTDQTNFPVLISGTYSYLATMGHGGNVTNANGYDIIFTSDSAGNDKLAFEQESYSATTGAINYWVNVPTVSHTVGTVIYMFYGNSSVTTDQSNKTGTWNTNYVGVWHLPDGTSLTANDSTVTGDTGTVHGAAATGGEIGGGGSFDGSSSYIDLGTPSALNISHQGTIEVWVNANVNNTNYPSPFGDENVDNDHNGVEFYFTSNASVFEIGNAGTRNTIDVLSTKPTVGVWEQWVGTFDGSNLNFYKNGSPIGTLAQTVDATTGVYPWTIGRDGADSTADNPFFNGDIDEARISNIARSADWIATEYSNESNPGAFYSVGTAVPGSGTGSSGIESITSNGTTYTRYFYVSDVYRDTSGNVTSTTGNCVASATCYDPSTKKITVVYGWTGVGAATSSITEYVTRDRPSVFNQADWSGGPGQNGPITNATNTFASDTSIIYTTPGAISVAPATSSNNTYTYERAITIDHTKVPNTDQTNFPVLFSGTYSYLATAANGGNVTSDSGYDIIFAADSAGTQPLNFDRESYSSSTGAVNYWVSVPTVYHATDTVFYILYDNSNVVLDQLNPPAVWSAGNYVGVWHMDETLTGQGQSAYDSSPEGNTVTSMGTWTGAQQVSGQIGGSLLFNGTDNDLQVYGPYTSLGVTTNMTIELWAKRVATDVNWNGLVVSCDGGCESMPYAYGFYNNHQLLATQPSSFEVSGNTAMTSTSTWYSLAVSKSGTTASFFLNGSSDGSGTVDGTMGDAFFSSLFYIGSDDNYDGHSGTLNLTDDFGHAYLDEVRLSNVAHSADWIATEYNNESSPSTFYNVGNAGTP